MNQREEYGDTTQRCGYCGKPEVSWLWSISAPLRNVQYCSLGCSARDNQSLNLGCCLCFLPLTAFLSVGLVLEIMAQNQIGVEFSFLFGLALLTQIAMVYQVYVGRR